jgi:hypothetical protein
MKINKLITLVIAFILVFSTVGIAFAEDGTGDPPDLGACDPADPGCEPTESETGDGWTHPIVALLAAYMEYQQPAEETDPGTCDPADPGCDPADPGTCDPTDPGCEPADPEAAPSMSFEEEIAALHADGVGFGVLVKLMSLSDRGDTSLTTLVEEFKNGQGFKQIYEDYGDPDKKGVGQVKQELKCVENGGEDCSSAKGNGKGKGKDKKDKKEGNRLFSWDLTWL